MVSVECIYKMLESCDLRIENLQEGIKKREADEDEMTKIQVGCSSLILEMVKLEKMIYNILLNKKNNMLLQKIIERWGEKLTDAMEKTSELVRLDYLDESYHLNFCKNSIEARNNLLFVCDL